MKTCPRCKQSKRASAFTKNSSRKDGLDSVCKQCRKDYRQNNKATENARKKRQQADPEFLKKYNTRKATSRKFGKPKQYKCAVLSCKRKAQEFHHINYDTADLALPLCKKHHRNIHGR